VPWLILLTILPETFAPGAANSWVQAAVVVALAGLWLSPLVVAGLTLWWDGAPWARIGYALGMGVGLGSLLLLQGTYWPRAWERSGRVYMWLGVRWFKRWTPDGDWVAAQLRRALLDYRPIARRTDSATSRGGRAVRNRYTRSCSRWRCHPCCTPLSPAGQCSRGGSSLAICSPTCTRSWSRGTTARVQRCWDRARRARLPHGVG
jgi:hypothetical protein